MIDTNSEHPSDSTEETVSITPLDPETSELILGLMTDLDDFYRKVATRNVTAAKDLFHAILKVEATAKGEADSYKFDIALQTLITNLQVVDAWFMFAVSSKCNKTISKLELIKRMQPIRALMPDLRALLRPLFSLNYKNGLMLSQAVKKLDGILEGNIDESRLQTILSHLSGVLKEAGERLGSAQTSFQGVCKSLQERVVAIQLD
jgi:hypothetical protein